MLKQLSAVPLRQVTVQGGFWGKRQKINREVTLPAIYQRCKETGRYDTFKLRYKPEQIDVPMPHHYWDSDVGKWIEAEAYDLAHRRNEQVEARIDEVIDDMEKAQWEDGYLNSFFSVIDSITRFENVYILHELYCAGHLIEAAVAYYQATGKKKFLDIMCRYADCIDRNFGPEDGKIQGYPGHQEIELALVKLYHVTNEVRYLRLSKYFIDQRGKQPYFFDSEPSRKQEPKYYEYKEILERDYLQAGPYALFQSHLPVREQKTAEGHSVRMMYMCCAMADLAAETDDESLLVATKRLWNNVTKERMYIIGGVSPQDISERFSFNYQLPNETAYNETCATIGLFMWAYRMLAFGAQREYSDIMDQALYNGIISGLSVEGDHFFYANHTASCPEVYKNKVMRNERMLPQRQKWFPVSCCPPNIARLTGSIGQYAYSVKADDLFIHLFIDSNIHLDTPNNHMDICVKTNYPIESEVLLTLHPTKKQKQCIYLRNPQWSHNTKILVNQREIPVYEIQTEGGYLCLDGVWCDNDEIKLILDMKPRFIQAHPGVRMNCAKVALMRGPIVYCLEAADNGKNVFDIMTRLNASIIEHFDEHLLGGAYVLEWDGKKRKISGWENQLYKEGCFEMEEYHITAIPYYLWANRGDGEMTVFMNALLE